MPLATSMTLAPVSSQTLAISLMNEILVARKALDGELDHLGAGDVGAHERGVERRVELDDGVAGPVAVVADDHAVGSRKSATAEPSLRNSGQET